MVDSPLLLPHRGPKQLLAVAAQQFLDASL
jgi:hypothetical protein